MSQIMSTPAEQAAYREARETSLRTAGTGTLKLGDGYKNVPFQGTRRPNQEGYDLYMAAQAQSVRVGHLKRQLLQLHYPVQTGGDFDAATQVQVRAFQAAEGLPVTGVVDAGTWSMLVTAINRDVPPYSPTVTTRRSGPSGPLRLYADGRPVTPRQRAPRAAGGNPDLLQDIRDWGGTVQDLFAHNPLHTISFADVPLPSTAEAVQTQQDVQQQVPPRGAGEQKLKLVLAGLGLIGIGAWLSRRLG